MKQVPESSGYLAIYVNAGGAYAHQLSRCPARAEQIANPRCHLSVRLGPALFTGLEQTPGTGEGTRQPSSRCVSGLAPCKRPARSIGNDPCSFSERRPKHTGDHNCTAELEQQPRSVGLHDGLHARAAAQSPGCRFHVIRHCVL